MWPGAQQLLPHAVPACDGWAHGCRQAGAMGGERGRPGRWGLAGGSRVHAAEGVERLPRRAIVVVW